MTPLLITTQAFVLTAMYIHMHKNTHYRVWYREYVLILSIVGADSWPICSLLCCFLSYCPVKDVTHPADWLCGISDNGIGYSSGYPWTHASLIVLSWPSWFPHPACQLQACVYVDCSNGSIRMIGRPSTLIRLHPIGTITTCSLAYTRLYMWAGVETGQMCVESGRSSIIAGSSWLASSFHSLSLSLSLSLLPPSFSYPH